MSDDLDYVGRVQHQWTRERPDLDTRALGIVGRLQRLADAVQAEIRPVYEAAGLTEGDFEVLAALRRTGDPFALTPGQLAESTLITSGTVTKRVDRLTAAGLVTRERVDHDGRVRRIALTDSGRAVVDEVVEAHFVNQERLLAGFSEIERARLTRLLTQWTISLGL